VSARSGANPDWVERDGLDADFPYRLNARPMSHAPPSTVEEEPREPDEVVNMYEAAWQAEKARRERLLHYAEADDSSTQDLASQDLGLPPGLESEADVLTEDDQQTMAEEDYEEGADSSRYTLDRSVLSLLHGQPRPDVNDILERAIREKEARDPRHRRPFMYAIPGEADAHTHDTAEDDGLTQYGEDESEELRASIGDPTPRLRSDHWDELGLASDEEAVAQHYVLRLEKERKRLAEIALQREARRQQRMLQEMARKLEEAHERDEASPEEDETVGVQPNHQVSENPDMQNVVGERAYDAMRRMSTASIQSAAEMHQSRSARSLGADTLSTSPRSGSPLSKRKPEVLLRRAVLEDKTQSRLWSALIKDRSTRPVSARFDSSKSASENLTDLINRQERPRSADTRSMLSVLARGTSKRQRAIRNAIIASSMSSNSSESTSTTAFSTALSIHRNPTKATDHNNMMVSRTWKSGELEAMGALGYTRRPGMQGMGHSSESGDQANDSGNAKHFATAASRYDARIAAANFHGRGLDGDVDEGGSTLTLTSEYPISPRELAHLLRLPSGGRAMLRKHKHNELSGNQPTSASTSHSKTHSSEACRDDPGHEGESAADDGNLGTNEVHQDEDSDDELQFYGDVPKGSVHQRLYGQATARQQQERAMRSHQFIKPKSGPYSTIVPPLIDPRATFRDFPEEFKRALDARREEFNKRQRKAAEALAEEKRIRETGGAKPFQEAIKALGDSIPAHIETLAKPLKVRTRPEPTSDSSGPRVIPPLSADSQAVVERLYSSAHGTPSQDALNVEKRLHPFTPSTTWREKNPNLLKDGRDVVARLTDSAHAKKEVKPPAHETFKPSVPLPKDRAIMSKLEEYLKMDVVERIQLQAQELELRRNLKKQALWPYGGQMPQFKAMPVPLSVLAPKKPLHERMRPRTSSTSPSRPRTGASGSDAEAQRLQPSETTSNAPPSNDLNATAPSSVLSQFSPSIHSLPIPNASATELTAELLTPSAPAADANVHSSNADVSVAPTLHLRSQDSLPKSLILPFSTIQVSPKQSSSAPSPSADTMPAGPMHLPIIETFGPEALDDVSSARSQTASNLPSTRNSRRAFWEGGSQTSARSRRANLAKTKQAKSFASTASSITARSSQGHEASAGAQQAGGGQGMSDLAVYLRSMTNQ